MKILNLLAICSALANAQQYGQPIQLTNGFNITVTWNSTTHLVTFVAVIPDKTWLGIVLGSFSHTNSDMISFNANGASSAFYDLYSEG